MTLAALEIDGIDAMAECSSFDFATPNATYVIPTGSSEKWASIALGPGGFTIVIVGPSDRLRAMVDDGVSDHAVKVTVSGMSLSVPVRFWREWDADDGTRQMFGCLSTRPGVDPWWIDESGSAPAERG